MMLRLLTACALMLTTDALVIGGVGAATPRASVSMMAKTKTKMVKVLLSTDVDGLGPKGTVVEVKSAYAQNVLVPKKLGAVPTKEMLEQLAARGDAHVLAGAAHAAGPPLWNVRRPPPGDGDARAPNCQHADSVAMSRHSSGHDTRDS